MPPLPHSWSQIKAKAQWHRPNCNLLVVRKASQLSDWVSSLAMHWNLSEKRLSKYSLFTGQLSFEVQSTNVDWTSKGRVCSTHSTQITKWSRPVEKKVARKQTWKCLLVLNISTPISERPLQYLKNCNLKVYSSNSTFHRKSLLTIDKHEWWEEMCMY